MVLLGFSHDIGCNLFCFVFCFLVFYVNFVNKVNLLLFLL